MFIARSTVIRTYEKNAISAKTAEVTTQLKILADYLSSSGYLLDSSQENQNREIEQLSNLYDGRILIVNGDFNVIKDTYGISQSKTVISEEVIKCFSGNISSSYDDANQFIELTVPIQGESSTDVIGVMLTSASTADILSMKETLGRSVFILEIIIAIIVIALAVLHANILIRPFNRVTQIINDIDAGFEKDVIVENGYTEMDSIIGALNQQIARMKKLDDSRQEFVSNVSHELKTPLASMKVLADSLNMMGDAPVEMYKEFMEDITHEIDRENEIITDLLSLVKMDKTEGTLNIKTVNVYEMLELILKRLTPIAQQNNIELILESSREVIAEIDEVKLTLAFSNLVENAIKYNRKDGWVKVVLDADHQFFLLEVSDSGIGIPEEALDSIFERFYRVDKSHSREIGGTGLGLAITRSAILMHRGSVKVTSTEGEGTMFTVRIPLTYIQ